MGSKVDPQTVGHRYYLGMHHIIAHNSVTALRRIVVGDVTVWEGNVIDNETIYVDKPYAFGTYFEEGGITGYVDVEFGGFNQPQNEYLARLIGKEVPHYTGVFGAVLNQVYLGNSPYIKTWSYVCEAYHDAWYPEKCNINGHHNPAHIFYDVITNQEYGLGYTATDIDLDSFVAAADALYDDDFGLSFIWSHEQGTEEFFIEILRHINAAIYIKPSTGLWTLKLIRDDYDIDDLKTFDESNIVNVMSYGRPALGEIVNEVILTYKGGDDNKPHNVTVHDSALLSKQGHTITSTVKLSAIPNANLANRVAQRQLTQLGAPVAKVELEVNRDAYEYGIGDVFKWSWDAFGVDQMVLRIVEISYGSLEDNRIVLLCTQDVFSISNTIYIDPPNTEWVNPASLAGDIEEVVIEEAPYLYLATKDGVGTDVDIGDAQVLIMARHPTTDSLGYAITSKTTGSSYRFTGDGFFTPSLYLASDINYTDTEIEFFSDLGTLSMRTDIDSFLVIGGEWCKLTNVNTTSNKCTIERGCNDTRPRKHSAGTIAFFNAFFSTDFEDVFRGSPEEVDYKLLTRTGIDFLSPGDATVREYTTNFRVSRPYTVARVLVEGEYFPEDPVDFGASLTLSWKERDRLAQNEVVVDDTNTSNFTPTESIEYNVYIYNGSNNALMRLDTGLTGTTYTYYRNEYLLDVGGVLAETLRFEIEAINTTSTLTSWQTYEVPVKLNLPPHYDEYSVAIRYIEEFIGAEAYYMMIEYNILTVVDWLNNGNSGMYQGTPIWDYALSVPVFAQPTVKFNGDSGVLIDKTVIDTASSDFTINMWVKLDAVDTGSRQVLFSQHHKLDNVFTLQISEFGGNLEVAKDISSNLTVSTEALSASTLYFISYSESDLHGATLYIDGVAVDNQPRASTSIEPDEISIGYNSQNDSQYTTGQIAGVSLHQVELQSSLLSFLNSTGRTPVVSLYDLTTIYTTPLLFYQNNESAGPLLIDYSSTGLDGTFGGSPAFDQGGPGPYVSEDKSILYTGSTYASILSNEVGPHGLSSVGADGHFYMNVWIRTTSTDSGGSNWHPANTIIELRQRGNSGTEKVAFCLGIDDGKVWFGRSNGHTAGSEHTVSELEVNDGEFHLITAILSVSLNEVLIMIDGSMSHVYTFSTATGDCSVGNLATDCTLGCRSTDAGGRTGYFDGNISYFTLYKDIGISPSPADLNVIRMLYLWSKTGAIQNINFSTILSSPDVTFDAYLLRATSAGGATNKRVVCYAPMSEMSRFVARFDYQGGADQVYIGISPSADPVNRSKYVGELETDWAFRMDGFSFNDGNSTNLYNGVYAAPNNIRELFYDGPGRSLLVSAAGAVPIIVHQDIPNDEDMYFVTSVYDNEESNFNPGTFGSWPRLPRFFLSLDGSRASADLHMFDSDLTFDDYDGARFKTALDTSVFKSLSSVEASVFNTTGRSSGRYAFEFRHSAQGSLGLNRIGFSPTRDKTTKIGDIAGSVSYSMNGQVYIDGAYVQIISSNPSNGWIMAIADLDTGEFLINIGDSGAIEVASGLSGTMYPAFSTTSEHTHFEVNLGERDFINTMPDDCYSWDGRQYQPDVDPTLDLTAAIAEANLHSPYALYPLNEAPVGTVAEDVSGNGRDGTLHGGCTTGVLVENINCAFFDGINDYIELPTGFDDFTSGMTLFILARPTSNGVNAPFIQMSTTHNRDLINFHRFGTQDRARLLEQAANTAILNDQTSGSGYIEWFNWHTYAVRQDSSGYVYLYVDGVLDSSNTDPDFPTVITRLLNYIGKSTGGTDAYFKGSMALVGIYDSDIGATAILDIHNEIGL